MWPISSYISFTVTLVNAKKLPSGKELFIVMILGWLTYLAIIALSTSSFSQPDGIGSSNPISSAMAVKYSLKIFATSFGWRIILSFSHKIISLIDLPLLFTNGLIVGQKCWFLGPPSQRCSKYLRYDESQFHTFVTQYAKAFKIFRIWIFIF